MSVTSATVSSVWVCESQSFFVVGVSGWEGQVFGVGRSGWNKQSIRGGSVKLWRTRVFQCLRRLRSFQDSEGVQEPELSRGGSVGVRGLSFGVGWSG